MTTAILCRYDNMNNKPVVFLADKIDYEKKTIPAWRDNQTQEVGLDYYHSTVPLSQADNKALMQQFMNATQNPDVVLRDRLPRQAKQRPNVLTQGAAVIAPLTPQTQQEAPQGARQRNKRNVPNRIASQPVGASNGFQFDIRAAIEATRTEFNDKLNALLRASGVSA